MQARRREKDQHVEDQTDEDEWPDQVWPDIDGLVVQHEEWLGAEIIWLDQDSWIWSRSKEQLQDAIYSFDTNVIQTHLGRR